jgi:hypothetical protein
VKVLSDYSEAQQKKLFENRKINSTKRFIESELAHCLGGYDKSNYNVNKLLPYIENAIRQAQQLDVNLEERWIEGQLGTRVYQLVKRLIAPLN